MRFVATIGERQITIDVEENGHLREVTVDGITGRADWQPVGNLERHPGGATHYTLLLGTQSFDVYVARLAPATLGAAPTFEVTLAGQTFDVRLEDERLHALAGMASTAHEAGEAALAAPMPGLVSQVVAAVGQQVERGQTVIVLEAMKMENDLGAPRAGIVRRIHVARGDTVNQGQVLAVVGDAAAATIADDQDE
ncbi:MAG TPA: acetyl-CoA carboxylase biotin carboxyl carrier protein subunit [Ktedonobacterales bacterium]|nr:acetyl-CoA carboxylase biotin carboxyl carrier protein subunit [Ktedonobacterales bacterium]